MGYRALLCAVLMLVVVAAPARAHEAHVSHRDTIQELNFDFVGAIEANEDVMPASAFGDAGLTYLPLRWCGTARSTDDTENQVHDPSLPQVKFVYAYASDQTDRTAAWADLLQANASLISRFYAQQSDSLRAPRFDMGTSCGAQYIDVATVQLPNPRSSYVDSFAAVKSAVNAALPRTSGQPRNYVILADKLSSLAAGSLWGQGELAAGANTKGAGNYHNGGGFTSIMWIPQAQTLPSTEASKNQGFWPEGFLHEMQHNFGAVMNAAPNSTGAGHCRDGRDVMCYSDGGLSYDPNVCPTVTSFTTQFVQMLDCGRDDYFSPAPASGSWLESHHNTFDSLFNADCPTLGDQCGGGGGPAVTGGPAVVGTARQGRTLTAELGTWSGDPSLSYEWEEEVSGSWQTYATGSPTITLTSANIGRRYRLKVTAVGTWTVVARSNPTASVTAPLTPVIISRPSVSGTARNGDTVTGTTGTWTNAQTLAYQWIRSDGVFEDIPGATSLTHTLTPDDIGFYLRLRVTATSEDGISTTTTSGNALGPVSSAPINDAAPSVSGTAKVSKTLTSTLGSWSQTVTSYARAWQREVGGEWVSIAGATGSTYAPTSDDLGLRLRVQVTASNSSGSTVVASAPTAAVVPLAPPVNTALPVVTGTLQEGQTLTAGSDTWTESPTTSVAWQRRAPGGDWTTISGATGRTYVLAGADVDGDVRAVVTATNADGSASAASAARGPIVTSVAPDNTAVPVVSGTPRTGQVLSATTGSWIRAQSYAYAWQRLSGGVWAPIAGATASTYIPVAADGGKQLRVVVTATGPGGSTAMPSALTAPVVDPPVSVAVPTVAGTAKRGQTLTASPGTWTNATSYAYAWERETGGVWNAIAGASSAAYVPGAADVGHGLRVRVTASNSTGAADPVVSAATAAIADLQPPVMVVAPLTTGTLLDGEVMTVGGDFWTGATTVTVQWQRRPAGGAWSPIAGATGRTYLLGSADRGMYVRALVTASNGDGDTAVASNEQGPIGPEPIVTPPPVDPAPTPDPDPTPPTTPVPPSPVPPAPTDPDPTDPLPLSVKAKVALKAGKRSAGTLVFTVTRTSPTAATTAIDGRSLKAANGTYTVRLCAGRRCVTRKVKIARRALKVAKQALPAASGRIDVTLKPRRGSPLTGRLTLKG